MAKARAKRRTGRPSKFTPETKAKILEVVGVGVPFSVAAKYAGIDERNLRRWIEKGRSETKGEYHAFVDALDQAESKAEVRVVAEWQKHLPKKWEACRDFLARRFPERWAETQKLHVLVEKEVEGMLADLQRTLSPEVYRQVLEGLAAAGRGGAPPGPAGGAGSGTAGEG